jgi:thiamine biosynthesis lipoprotein
MGCDILVGGGTPAECLAIERLFTDRDEMFSRFRTDSELSRVNANAGVATVVSQCFAEMVELALQAARETGGVVVPTLGDALEAAGYDADFALLADEGPARTPAARLDPAVRVEGTTLTVPRGVKLDLNGVVKGSTVDEALAMLGSDGFVSAGGDLAARGGLVAALPRGGAVRLVRGGLATSGTDRRAWFRGGRRQHHLIDPVTGSPAASPWEQATVCGASCVAADVAAKAAFLLGAHAPSWLDDRGLPGRFITSTGAIRTNHSWRTSMKRAVPCT